MILNKNFYIFDLDDTLILTSYYDNYCLPVEYNNKVKNYLNYLKLHDKKIVLTTYNSNPHKILKDLGILNLFDAIEQPIMIDLKEYDELIKTNKLNKNDCNFIKTKNNEKIRVYYKKSIMVQKLLKQFNMASNESVFMDDTIENIKDVNKKLNIDCLFVKKNIGIFDSILEIYTDGACDNIKTKKGGFGVYSEDLCIKYNEQHNNTTNNIMELTAIMWVLKYLNHHKIINKIIIYSDSLYSINCCNIWYKQWEKNNKLNTKKNINIIQECVKLLDKNKNIKLKYVKGHANIKGNEIADKLATSTELTNILPF